eukprot:11568998-Alexandrium_andersonii.AAC.1
MAQAPLLQVVDRFRCFYTSLHNAPGTYRFARLYTGPRASAHAPTKVEMHFDELVQKVPGALYELVDT